MTTLAPGIFLFESGKAGPRRLYSAGIHGDEVEGQKVLHAVQKDLETEKVQVTCGSVMIIFANLNAIEEKKRVASDGCDFNRQFHTDTTVRINEIKKWVTTFNPTLHRDLHSTIQPVPYSFALCSRAVAHAKGDFTEFALRYSLQHIVQFVYPPDRMLTTFAGYTAQNFGAESFTLELGQIGSSRARRMMPTIIKAIFSEIEMKPVRPSTLSLNLWRMGKKIVKQSEHFQFTRRFENFEPVPEGELVATDEDRKYYAPQNSALLFMNESVPVGGRAGVFISLS